MPKYTTRDERHETTHKHSKWPVNKQVEIIVDNPIWSWKCHAKSMRCNSKLYGYEHTNVKKYITWQSKQEI